MKRTKAQNQATQPNPREPMNAPDAVDDDDVAGRDAKMASAKPVIRKNPSKASHSTRLLIRTMGLPTQIQAKRLTNPRLTKWKGNAKLAVLAVAVAEYADVQMNL